MLNEKLNSSIFFEAFYIAMRYWAKEFSPVLTPKLYSLPNETKEQLMGRYIEAIKQHPDLEMIIISEINNIICDANSSYQSYLTIKEINDRMEVWLSKVEEMGFSNPMHN